MHDHGNLFSNLTWKRLPIGPIYSLLQSRVVNWYMPHLSIWLKLLLLLFMFKNVPVVFSLLKEILWLEFLIVSWQILSFYKWL